MIKFNIKLLSIFFVIIISLKPLHSAEMVEPIKVDWSFKGLTGTFDRASLQRGFQVYKEVCSSCHSMQYLSYRNLGEPGGPEFSDAEVKAIAASFEIQDGPDSQGEMFFRPGKPSDKFKSPYPNEQAAIAANGGAYPPDMSVLVKARKGGANYIYSVLVGYEDPPPGVKLDDGVYYNKYMVGNKIKMPNNLIDGLVEYSDGTDSTMEQMAKDVTTFLAWAAEPELEIRHKTGIKVMIYLILLTTLVYLSMKKIWSRIDPKV
ncbi:MAG: cytochrome c1 [Candidatus Pelagibacter sp. TMED273]|nr:MAG: cytochrome c1 [Candidatus Pelagibacter sp. TMED273]|tara:strand:+ start:40 stop:822 length:783 start_codon:yes stop_codon:yes gene_type:complete